MKTFIQSIALLLIVMIAGLTFETSPASARIYKWKDENGKTHFTDSPSKIPLQYRKNTGNNPAPKKKTLKLKKPNTSSDTIPFKKSAVFDKENVTVKYNYYDIRGDKADELREQLDALGPYSDKEGKNFDGLTQWRVAWKSRYRFRGEECLEFKVFTEAQIIYTMPKWVNYSKGPVGLRQRWDRYYDALDTHEHGHGKHGVLALKEIERSLPKVQKGKSCQQLEKTFKAKVDQIIDKYNRIDVQYDKETKHGYTQGAIFP